MEQSPDKLGLFDVVLMNPPFHMRADIKHIEQARQFLKPGGVIVALCMDTHHRETALRQLASTWQKIPAGAFKSEGTNIAAILLTICKT
jgi:16S rRNA G1207 methylase RsmC